MMERVSDAPEFLGMLVDPARVAWIKRMRQREGIRRELPDLPLALFGASDWEELTRNIEMAGEMMGVTVVRSAIMNALGFEQEGRSVIERREKLAPTFGISVRTVERLEDEGARALAYYIERMLDPLFIDSQIVTLEGVVGMLKWSTSHNGVKVPDTVWEQFNVALQGLSTAYVEADRERHHV